MLRGVAVPVLAAILLLAGCTSNSRNDTASAPSSEQTTASVAPTATVVDAAYLCALFTAEDFKAVTGEPLAGEPYSHVEGGPSLGNCDYADKWNLIKVGIAAWRTGPFARHEMGIAGRPVKGLHTKAYWDQRAGLTVLMHSPQNWYLHISVDDHRPDGANPRTSCMRAARLILNKS